METSRLIIVWQKTAAGDVWLSEGVGIIPKRDDYV